MTTYKSFKFGIKRSATIPLRIWRARTGFNESVNNCREKEREIMCICVYVRNQYMYGYDYLRRDREMEIGTPISVCLWRKRLLLAWNYILDELAELKRYSHFHPNTAELTHFGLNPLQWRNDGMPVWVSNGAGNNYFYFLIVYGLHTTI